MSGLSGSIHFAARSARQTDGLHQAAVDSLTLHGFDSRLLDSTALGATQARHTQLGAGVMQATVERIALKDIALRRSRFSVAVRATIEMPPDLVTLGFALAAPEPFRIGGQSVAESGITVFGAGEGCEVLYAPWSHGLTIAMPARLYACAIAAASPVDQLRWPRANPVLQPTADGAARLKSVVAAIECCAVRHPDLFADPQWKANVQGQLVETLLDTVAGAPAARQADPPPGSARRIFMAAEEWIGADRMTIPSVPAICAALGVSRRTLERAYRDMLNVSPAHHLRVRALNAARQDLLDGEPLPGAITRAALDNGFWHMGRFSAAYRALFGERPVDTLRSAAVRGRTPAPRRRESD